MVFVRINQENGIHHHHDNEMVHTDDFMGLREEKSGKILGGVGL